MTRNNMQQGENFKKAVNYNAENLIFRQYVDNFLNGVKLFQNAYKQRDNIYFWENHFLIPNK